MEQLPKYRSTFDVRASFYKKESSDESLISKASANLDELKSLLPSADEILNNPDLLYTCFNAAVANLVNLNGDAITTSGAKSLVASCKNKPMNIEHERGSVIGFITNYGFASFGDNKLLTLDELSDDPFNISLAAIVWKICNRGFAEIIQECQDERGFCYQAISTSWEVGFDSYKLALGSKNLTKAKIVDDEKLIEEYSKYLISEGGSGFLPDGTELYRVIGDDCRFLGCAFTTNPAAAVKGVVSVDYRDVQEDQEDEDEEENEDENDEESDSSQAAEASVNSESLTNFIKNKEESSQSTKKRVIKRMKYNTIDELVDNLHEAHASDVRDFISVQVQKANEQFVALQAEKAEKEKALEDAIASANEFKEQTDSLKAEVDQLRASIKAQEDQVKVGDRMESLKEQFDIDQAAAKTITKKIFGLSDEAFAEWLEEMKPFLKVKSEKSEANLESAASLNAPIPNSQSNSEKKADEYRNILKSIKVTV